MLKRLYILRVVSFLDARSQNIFRNDSYKSERERGRERGGESRGGYVGGGRGGTSLPLAYGIFVPISEWLLVAFSYLLLIEKLLDPKTTPPPPLT